MTTHTTDKNEQLLSRYLPLLLKHGEEILLTPEMAECAVSAGICYGPMNGRLDLGALLQRWLTPGSPWVHRYKGKSYYILRAVYGVGGCCYYGCGLDAETGEFTEGLHPRGFDLLKFRSSLPRAPRRPLPTAPLQGLQKPRSSFSEWERQTSSADGRRAYMIDPTRQVTPPTMNLEEVISHFLPQRPLILNIPHASVELPCSVPFSLSGEALRREAMRAADLYTDKLFRPQVGLISVEASVSRLVADTERYTDDAAEPAAAYGQGVLCTRTTDGKPLRPAPSAAERQELLRAYYHPHHERLSLHTAHSLRRHGSALLLDVHSYPGSYRMSGMQDREQPDICIGTAEGHTTPELVGMMQRLCRKYGYSTAVNSPYSGSIIPAGFEQDGRVRSIMAEIKRSLYMNEDDFSLHEGFARLQQWAEELAGQLRTGGY